MTKSDSWLDRTLLLMRDDVHPDTPDEALKHALTSTKVVLIADAECLDSRSAQTAITTTAFLLARSGHQVVLQMPDVPLLEPVAPLCSGGIVSALIALNERLVPISAFTSHDASDADLAAVFGAASPNPVAGLVVAAIAGPWGGALRRYAGREPWPNDLTWPFGAMTAATLIAAEAFKISMRKLREFARTPELFDEQFAACQEIEFVLPTALSPTCQDLGDFDLISGGAISHAVLYCLSRIDNVSGRARVVEPDIADFTNLNRYMLLTVSDVPDPKAERLTQLQLAGLSVTGIESRFDFPPSRELGSLASNVLVGVDDIATRWSVQLTNPAWLGIGATTHWSAMASFHREGLACARCLHPDDDAEQNLIPTAAFVSFFAGLLLAAYFVRHVAGGVEPAREQQTYLTALQSETALTMPVALRQHCPLCGASRRAA